MAAKQTPKNGESKRRPKNGGAGSHPAGRVISVRSRGPRFQRVGIVFTNSLATIVREDEVGEATFERILAEPQLRCEPVAE